MNKRIQICMNVIVVMLLFGLWSHAKPVFATQLDAYQDNPENAYIDIGDQVDDYQKASTYGRLLRSSVIPAKYDARDEGYVTSVKNQLPYGTCWAFSAMGAAESYMLKKGVTNPDYSELQLIYFTYHHVDDALKNLKGDATTSQGYLTYGSTNTSTVFALASWIGVGNDSVAPYSTVTANANATLSTSLAYQDVLHLKNASIVSMKNTEDVKQLILNHGSVVSAIRMYTNTYYNTATDALYQNVSKTADHSILIIGWDDTYSKDNFATGHQPSTDGAWLIKNSWGTEKPYIWVSYEDLCLLNQNAYGYAFVEANDYDYNYQYDGSVSTHSETMVNGSTIANKYQVTASAKEKIGAVSFALRSDNVAYSIQLYKNSGAANPFSGTPLLTTPVTGTTTYAGYYTVDFNQEVILEKGDTFTVAITLTDTDDDSVVYYADANGSNSGVVEYVSYTEPGQSFLCENGVTQDLYNKYPGEGICARIKAFSTVVEPLSQESSGTEGSTTEAADTTPISISKATVSTISNKSYTGKAIKPTPTVRYNGKKLTKGKDYKLSYSNNKKRGKATVTITGIGKYKGTKKVTFQIVAKVKYKTVYKGVNYSAVYDYNYYVDKYPSLWKKYGTNDTKVLAYFVKTGMAKGHQAKASFNVKSYAYRYYDLRKLYKNDLKKYYMHYIKKGKKQGRKATGTKTMQGGPTKYNGVNYSPVFRVGYYANKYPDLRKIYGLDDDAYLEHFVEFGMAEGRQARAIFCVQNYRKRYEDLRKFFGKDWKAYYLHYLEFGRKEGRNGK